MTAAPSLAVVVVNYRSSELIESNVGRLSGSRAQVVVVDNYSDERERSRVRLLVARFGWTLVEMSTNAGFGAGVNAGVRAAARRGCDRFLLLNPDAQVAVDTVEELSEHSSREPLSLISPLLLDAAGQVAFAGSLLDLADGRMTRWPPGATTLEPTADRVPWLTAACLVVSRELWERVHGFAEDYFLYWEDVDFNYRCLDAGAQLRLRTDLSALHQQGGTQGERRGRAKSGLYYYFNCRNRLVFAVRFLPRSTVRRWIWHTPQVSWEILMQGGRRQLGHSPGRAWAAAGGALAGMRLAFSAALAVQVSRRRAPR